jgi:hypothetical protein
VADDASTSIVYRVESQAEPFDRNANEYEIVAVGSPLVVRSAPLDKRKLLSPASGAEDYPSCAGSIGSISGKAQNAHASRFGLKRGSASSREGTESWLICYYRVRAERNFGEPVDVPARDFSSEFEAL